MHAWWIEMWVWKTGNGRWRGRSHRVSIGLWRVFYQCAVDANFDESKKKDTSLSFDKGPLNTS